MGSAVYNHDGKSGKLLRFTEEEKKKACALEAKHSLDGIAKMLGTTDITFMRVASGAWCKRSVIERIRARMAEVE